MMKKYAAFIVIGLVMILMPLIQISCSSSGGGGGDSDGDISAPATMDKANVDSALDYIVKTIPGCSTSNQVSANQVILDAVSLVKEQMENKKVKVSQPPSDAYEPAEAIDPPLEGTCGGNIKGDISSDESSGKISGDISINNFCLGDDVNRVFIDGPLNFSGKIDTESGDLSNLSAVSTGISLTTDEAGSQRSYFASFDVSLSTSGDSINLSVKSFILIDETEGTQVKIQNLTVNVTEGPDSASITMSGTIDVTDKGSVSFETQGPITVSQDGSTMTGTILVSGENNTSMQISIDDGVLNIQADTNGDGAYDYFPEALDCTDLSVDDISF